MISLSFYMDSVSLFVAHHINSNRPFSLGLRMDCLHQGLGWVGYQTLGSWTSFFMIYLPSFLGSHSVFTSSMNGCPDTLWATANSREERSDGAWPRMDFLGLQKGLISI